jgi:hypothetical protein
VIEVEDRFLEPGCYKTLAESLIARTDQDQTKLTRIRTLLENAQRGNNLLIQ